MSCVETFQWPQSVCLSSHHTTAAAKVLFISLLLSWFRFLFAANFFFFLFSNLFVSVNASLNSKADKLQFSCSTPSSTIRRSFMWGKKVSKRNRLVGWLSCVYSGGTKVNFLWKWHRSVHTSVRVPRGNNRRWWRWCDDGALMVDDHCQFTLSACVSNWIVVASLFYASKHNCFSLLIDLCCEDVEPHVANGDDVCTAIKSFVLFFFEWNPFQMKNKLNLKKRDDVYDNRSKCVTNDDWE